MNTTRSRRASLAAACSAALAALTLTATGATAATVGAATAHPGSGGAPIVRTDDGFVRGTAAGAVDEFLGIPYAAPPTGNLRWRPPADWPAMVTFSGSPPNRPMLRCTQRSAACWSISP